MNNCFRPHAHRSKETKNNSQRIGKERLDNQPDQIYASIINLSERRIRSDRPKRSRKYGCDGSGDDEGERQRFAAPNLETRVQRRMPLYMSRSYPTARQVLRKHEGHWIISGEIRNAVPT